MLDTGAVRARSPTGSDATTAACARRVVLPVTPVTTTSDNVDSVAVSAKFFVTRWPAPTRTVSFLAR